MKNDAFGLTPSWLPQHDHLHTAEHSNLMRFMRAHNFADYTALFDWSIVKRAEYWQAAIEAIKINFTQPYSAILDLSQGVASPRWLVDAQLNIAASCWQADPAKTAIIYKPVDGEIQRITYKQLHAMANQVANSLSALNLPAGAAIAIIMPMTVESVAIYLGVVQAGYVTVGIADSFAHEEIAKRAQLAHVQAVFTQDYILRAGKELPLYERIKQANAPISIVVPCVGNELKLELRQQDLTWQRFLQNNNEFTPVACVPHAAMNILFSSGTTGDPKAIVWDHTTPIKSAVDGYFHQDIQPTDVVAWPTSLGWMMGPWLIFATLINQATIALYYDAPNTRGFTEFVAQAGVTILGVVPSLVKIWRVKGYCAGLDWSKIKLFTSTGETSNPGDMEFLMQQAGNKPVIEYCGGTEIGGAYVSSTVLQANIPATFSTPTLGLDLKLIDECGVIVDNGEVAIVAPSIGLSRQLINKDNTQEYYANMPRMKDGTILRRHGDQMQRLDNGYYRSLGRADDAMNLGGIKISAAEIEHCLLEIPGVLECAAIGRQLPNTLTHLIIFVVPDDSKELDIGTLKLHMQQAINTKLNPLFKIEQVRLIDALPRTSSNKIMRRMLRNSYDA